MNRFICWLVPIIFSASLSAAPLPDSKDGNWGKNAPNVQKVLKETGGTFHNVYQSGAKTLFSDGFKSCKSSVTKALNKTYEQNKSQASRATTKTQQQQILAQAEQLKNGIGIYSHIHCIARLMAATTKLSTGVMSPKTADWEAALINFNSSELTEHAIGIINSDLKQSHEYFMQAEIELVGLPEEDKRKMKQMLGVREADLASAGQFRLQSYLTSFQGIFNIVSFWPAEFDCDFSSLTCG